MGVALASTITMMAAAACSSSDAGTQSGGLKFVLWDYKPETSRGLVADFKKEFTDVEVQTQIQPYAQYTSSVQFMQTGGESFDVLYTQDERLTQWSNWLQPIDDYPGAKELIAKLSPAAKQALTHDGKVYGLPYFLGFFAFTYNDQMLTKAGITAPPTTWDELLQQAKQLKSSGISQFPLVFPGGLGSSQISYVFYSILASMGGTLLDGQGAVTPQAKAALKWLVDAKQAGVLDPKVLQMDYETAPQAFMTGKHAFMLANVNSSGPAFANNPKESKVAGHAKLALMPGNGATVAWARGIGINKASKNKDKAWELVKYLGGTDKEGEYHAAETWMSAAGLAYGYSDEKLSTSGPVAKTLQAWTAPKLWNEQLQKAVHLSALTPFGQAGFAQFDDSLQRNLQEVISGKASVDSATSTIEAEAKRLGS